MNEQENKPDTEDTPARKTLTFLANVSFIALWIYLLPAAALMFAEKGDAISVNAQTGVVRDLTLRESASSAGKWLSGSAWWGVPALIGVAILFPYLLSTDKKLKALKEAQKRRRE